MELKDIVDEVQSENGSVTLSDNSSKQADIQGWLTFQSYPHFYC